MLLTKDLQERQLEACFRGREIRPAEIGPAKTDTFIATLTKTKREKVKAFFKVQVLNSQLVPF